MTMAAETVTTPADPRVVSCYDLLAFGQTNGVFDYTDARFKGVSGRGRARYERAQAAQADFLLDWIQCKPGSHVIDIGCGNGRVLKAVRARGAQGVGITISPPQVRYCQKLGLDVRLMNYLDLPAAWDGTFTGAVANGSIEHFPQLTDVLAGRLDAIYQHMFEIIRRMLPSGAYFATTVIHFRYRNQMDPHQIARGRKAFRRGTPEYHFADLALDTFGGYYPEPDQLERCARGQFNLVNEEDGTEDYRETSEIWLQRLQRSMLDPRLWAFCAKHAIKDRRATCDMLRSLLWDQSWMWQFRGDPSPMQLRRQLWQAA